MHTVQASADYFLWEEFMRSRVFPIFYRVVPVNAAKRKSKWKKWLDTPQLKRYQQFLAEWHSLKKNMQEYLSRLNTEDEKKTVCMMFLQIFFFRPYESGRDFYEEWEERRTQLQSILPE